MSVSTTSIDSLPTGGVMQPTGQPPAQMENTKIANPLQSLQEERDRDAGVYRSGPPPGPVNESHELISSLQQASSAGLTTLPSRDIPRDTERMQVDQQTRPNYVPEAKDYIGDHQAQLELDRLRANAKQQHASSSVEKTVNTLELPAILAVLYFLFQLPVTKTTVYRFLPQAFLEDGNYNLGGLLFMSIGYAAAYYGVSSLISMASNI